MGIAIIIIMLFHLEMINDSMAPRLFFWGNSGVDVFLLLSGLGIYFSLAKSGQCLQSYYLKRFIRIYVPFLLMIFPIATYALWKGNIPLNVYIVRLLGISAFFEGNKGYWYITACVVCYSFAPLLIVWINEKTFYTILLSFILCYGIATVCFTAEILFTRIPMFVIGMWIGKMCYNKDFSKGYNIIPLIGCALVCFAFLVANIKFISFPNICDKLLERLSLGLFAMPISLLIALCAGVCPGWFKKVIEYCGAKSLELYLCHLPIFHICEMLFDNLYLYIILSFVITFILTHVLYLVSNFLIKKISLVVL